MDVSWQDSESRRGKSRQGFQPSHIGHASLASYHSIMSVRMGSFGLAVMNLLGEGCISASEVCRRQGQKCLPYTHGISNP